MRPHYAGISFIILALASPGIGSSTENIWFKLEAGDGQSFTAPKDLIGTRTVCLYETRETKGVNEAFKDWIRDLHKSSESPAFSILAVADTTEAIAPIRGIWRRALVKESQEIGYTLWGDWDGRMRGFYSPAKGQANTLVLDRDASLLWKKVGPLSPEDFAHIKALLIQD